MSGISGLTYMSVAGNGLMLQKSVYGKDEKVVIKNIT